MKNLADKTAAVTGAASGIGRMLAVNLVREGCHLALADIDAAGLNETAGLVGSAVKVSTHVVDVARREQVFGFAAEAAGFHGGVDILINNAGVVVADFLESVPLEDFEWLMNINFWGVVYGTMAFLPYLKKRSEGHIVNISSINGILPFPNNGPYCAAKFAVKGYTESLAQEMQGTNIAVSCVHPGGIKTSIARNTRFNRLMEDLPREKARQMFEEKIFKMTADKAARVIIAGIKHGKRRILVGMDAKVLDLFTRLFPVQAVNLTALLSRNAARSYAAK
jgi:NAD(P)-dependent dehydrogenase (short-subunit alcohol dehydrogenase family)